MLCSVFQPVADGIISKTNTCTHSPAFHFHPFHVFIFFFSFFTHLIFTLEWYFIFEVGMGEGLYLFFQNLKGSENFPPLPFYVFYILKAQIEIFIHFYRIFIIVIKLMRNPKFASPSPQKNPLNLYFKELFSSLPFYLNIK